MCTAGGLPSIYDADAAARADCVAHTILAPTATSVSTTHVPAEGRARHVSARECDELRTSIGARPGRRLSFSMTMRALTHAGVGVARVTFDDAGSLHVHVADPTGSGLFAVAIAPIAHH